VEARRLQVGRECVAATSGSAITAAKDSLATSMKVAELPVVEDAMRAGQLSTAQATLPDLRVRDVQEGSQSA
jgi:hypothetical protein